MGFLPYARHFSRSCANPGDLRWSLEGPKEFSRKGQWARWPPLSVGMECDGVLVQVQDAGSLARR